MGPPLTVHARRASAEIADLDRVDAVAVGGRVQGAAVRAQLQLEHGDGRERADALPPRAARRPVDDAEVGGDGEAAVRGDDRRVGGYVGEVLRDVLPGGAAVGGLEDMADARAGALGPVPGEAF